jgi:hypothetical protein
VALVAGLGDFAAGFAAGLSDVFLGGGKRTESFAARKIGPASVAGVGSASY